MLQFMIVFSSLTTVCCNIYPKSQAAEGEFGFVIAVFAKDQNLISADLDASILLAVRISTIIPPFALRYTISYYNKIAERMVKQAEELERQRASTIDPKLSLTPQEKEQRLMVRSNLWIYLKLLHFRCAAFRTSNSSSFFLHQCTKNNCRKTSRRTRLFFFVFKSNVVLLGALFQKLSKLFPNWDSK